MKTGQLIDGLALVCIQYTKMTAFKLVLTNRLYLYESVGKTNQSFVPDCLLLRYDLQLLPFIHT